MKVNRIRKIEELLRDMHSLSIDYLCEYFNVSKNTIRRDIAEMDKNGCIKKVYGGIVLKETQEPVQEDKCGHNWVMNTTNLEAKMKIAQMAADLVEDEDVIYIDIGTTTALLLPYIENKKNVTIVTANIHAINAAVEAEKFNIIATGGTLYPPSKAFVGPSVTRSLSMYNISKFFMSTIGVSIENGATSASPLDCEIQYLLTSKPGKHYLMMDTSKLDAPSLVSYGTLEGFDAVITNEKPMQKYIDYLQDHQVELIYNGE